MSTLEQRAREFWDGPVSAKLDEIDTCIAFARLMLKEAREARMAEMEKLLKGARDADWGQVVANGGPPCFALDEKIGKFCLRAERWQGHGQEGFHEFFPLESLIRRTAAPPKEGNGR